MTGNISIFKNKSDILDSCKRMYKDLPCNDLKQPNPSFDRMHHSHLSDYQPFYMRSGDDFGLFLIATKSKDSKWSEFKLIKFKPNSQYPLFQNQKEHAKKFESLCLLESEKKNSSKEEQKIALKERLKEEKAKKDNLRICLWIETSKSEGKKSMYYAILFVSWMIETLDLSYPEIDLLVASIKNPQQTLTGEYFGNLCVFAGESPLNSSTLLNSEENVKKNITDGKIKHPFDVVFNLKDFSELEIVFR